MPLRKAQIDDSGINLTPMIDVVFLLVIFFMVGAKFSNSEGSIQVNVPGVENVRSMVRGPDKWVIEVTQDGVIYLDGQAIGEAQLADELRRGSSQFPGLGVVVRGDAQGTLETYTRVLSLCSRSGIQQLDVAVRKMR